MGICSSSSGALGSSRSADGRVRLRNRSLDGSLLPDNRLLMHRFPTPAAALLSALQLRGSGQQHRVFGYSTGLLKEDREGQQKCHDGKLPGKDRLARDRCRLLLDRGILEIEPVRRHRRASQAKVIMLLGAHISVSGGLHLAPDRAREIGLLRRPLTIVAMPTLNRVDSVLSA